MYRYDEIKHLYRDQVMAPRKTLIWRTPCKEMTSLPLHTTNRLLSRTCRSAFI